MELIKKNLKSVHFCFRFSPPAEIENLVEKLRAKLRELVQWRKYHPCSNESTNLAALVCMCRLTRFRRSECLIIDKLEHELQRIHNCPYLKILQAYLEFDPATNNIHQYAKCVDILLPPDV